MSRKKKIGRKHETAHSSGDSCFVGFLKAFVFLMTSKAAKSGTARPASSLPERLHLDGLFVVLPTQLADPLGGLLQHLLSCLLLMEVKFGLSCLERQHWMNETFYYHFKEE